MRHDYLFYVEVRAGEAWAVPHDLPRERAYNEPFRRLGCFCWTGLAVRDWSSLLFFGQSALFPLRKGPPSDWSMSPLLRSLNPLGDRRGHVPGWDITLIDPRDPYDRANLCWIPYEDLYVDSWDDFPVLLRSEIAAGAAPLFGDGQGAFPRDGLLAAGITPDVIDSVKHLAEWTETPLLAGHGAERFRLERLPSDALVPVTWQTTLAGFMGPYASDFQRLRKYGADEDLRILCTSR